MFINIIWNDITDDHLQPDIYKPIEEMQKQP